MMSIKKIASLLSMVFMLIPYVSWSQIPSIERDVVASTGYDTLTFDDFYFSYTVGEIAVETKTNNEYVLTEGFQQPLSTDPIFQPLSVLTAENEVLCPDVQDGTITVEPKGCVGPYTIELSGNNGDTITVDGIDKKHVFMNLDSGTYRITTRGLTLCASRDTVHIGMKNLSCDLKLYTGITPNGDGKNDFWSIDNIELNRTNSVQIFNRWGTLVWQAEDYNNENVKWTGVNKDDQELPTGTYFYVIEVPGNSSASGSGWIQLTR